MRMNGPLQCWTSAYFQNEKDSAMLAWNTVFCPVWHGHDWYRLWITRYCVCYFVQCIKAGAYRDEMAYRDKAAPKCLKKIRVWKKFIYSVPNDKLVVRCLNTEIHQINSSSKFSSNFLIIFLVVSKNIIQS